MEQLTAAEISWLLSLISEAPEKQQAHIGWLEENGFPPDAVERAKDLFFFKSGVREKLRAMHEAL